MNIIYINDYFANDNLIHNAILSQIFHYTGISLLNQFYVSESCILITNLLKNRHRFEESKTKENIMYLTLYLTELSFIKNETSFSMIKNISFR
jgi:hypothetical protein